MTFAGQTVVVTGSMSGEWAELSRTEVSELRAAAEAKVSSSVSVKMTMLIAGEEAGSKLVKATTINADAGRTVVTILSPAEAAALLAA